MLFCYYYTPQPTQHHLCHTWISLPWHYVGLFYKSIPLIHQLRSHHFCHHTQLHTRYFQIFYKSFSDHFQMFYYSSTVILRNVLLLYFENKIFKHDCYFINNKVNFLASFIILHFEMIFINQVILVNQNVSDEMFSNPFIKIIVLLLFYKSWIDFHIVNCFTTHFANYPIIRK